MTNEKSPTNVSDWISEKGKFERPPSAFRNWISSTKASEFPPEKGRYHLYVAYSCPWAHRTLILRQIKGLEDIISFTAMHWHQDEKGWRFATRSEQDLSLHMTPDPHHTDVTHLQDIYYGLCPDYKGRFTTPTLYDTKTGKIVNNESADIIRMMNSAFDGLLPDQDKSHDLYPASHRIQIDSANEWIYDGINNGVYRAGFAQTQESYESAVRDVFCSLEKAESHLRKMPHGEPYFFGTCITETDIRLFTTIVRFDPVYCQHFKVNLKDIRSGLPALHRWMRWLYWTEPAFKDTTRFGHIKWNYTKSHTQINPLGITPVGPVPDILPLDQEVGCVESSS